MPDTFFVGMENSHAAFRAELGFARITGIEKQNSAQRFGIRLVRVAKDDHVRPFTREAAFEFVVEGQRVDDVLDEKFPTGQFHDLGQLVAQTEIRVAQHDGDRRDLLQFKRNESIAHVPRVQDVVNARKNL